MFGPCTFLATADELQELLENGITPTTGERFDLMSLKNIGKKISKESERAELKRKPLDFAFLMPLEIFALIAAYLDPVDLISSRRVNFERPIAYLDGQDSWLNV